MTRGDPSQPHTSDLSSLSRALCRSTSVTVLCAMLGMMLANCAPAAAQTTEPAKPAAKPAKAAKAAPKPADAAAQPAAKDPAVAQRSYESGRAAYQAGKFESAIQSMNAAIQAGGLEQRILANALLVRGASFQKSGKPGQAISDLTSAMWLKDGLSASERTEASQFRSQAYKDAGLAEPASISASSAAAAPSQSSTGTDTVTRNLETASTRTAAAAVPIPTLNAVPTDGTTTPDTGLSGASVGKFFSNLFTPSQSSAPETASPAPPAPAAVAAPQPPPSSGPEVLPWATATGPAPSVPETKAAAPTLTATAAKTAPKPAPVKTAAAKPAAPAPAAGQGNYRIQVAAVKSRDEASAVIAKLQASGGVLATSPSAVDETTFGSMGTFFRVRLGPYASAAATKAPCDSLKAKGFDCLVTPN